METFVYPQGAGDPDAESVRASFVRNGFVRNGGDFASMLGRVQGNLYVGRTTAGGEGQALGLDNDGKDDVTFDQTCAFILQLKNGRVTAVAADRPVQATIAGQAHHLVAFTPVAIESA